MTESPYHTICHTCGEEFLSADVDGAKAVFREHSERGHMVEARDMILSTIRTTSEAQRPEGW